MPTDPMVIAALIASLCAGLATLIAAVVAGIVAIIKALHDTKAAITEKLETNAAVSKTMGDVRDKKLDRIEVLVDGRYGEVLQELADMKKALALATGLATDQVKSDEAQKRADLQEFRVNTAGGKNPPDSTP